MKIKRKPEWIRLKIQGSGTSKGVSDVLVNKHLNTVCQEANCPNKMECYEQGTATFMILGSKCTRNCKFCNVTTQRPEPLDPKEPENLALAVKELGLNHAVVTSVDRDDLEDEGANHFAETCRQIKKHNPNTTVELLTPDFHARKELLDIVLDSEPDIFNHNIEVVRSKFDYICPQSNYEHSMETLLYAKERGFVTKSGLMVGFGETKEEVFELLRELKGIGVDMVTIGQYLQPSKAHIDVEEYVHPDEFDEYAEYGLRLGFKRIESSPFVRSSYHASALTEEETEAI